MSIFSVFYGFFLSLVIYIMALHTNGENRLNLANSGFNSVALVIYARKVTSADVQGISTVAKCEGLDGVYWKMAKSISDNWQIPKHLTEN